MAQPRVLTFNFHEPYLCLMAKTGLSFNIGLYDDPQFKRQWHTKFRAVPPNCTFVDEQRWRRDLREGRYDVVVAQNEDNAMNIAKEVVESSTPALLVIHNNRNYIETTLPRAGEQAVQNYPKMLDILRHVFTFVFISDTKRRSFRVPGRVIYPGIDVDEYGGYRGEVAEVLRVGNMMGPRDVMFDVGFQQKVVDGLPYRVVGEDPTIPEATPSESFEELVEFYRSRRCLLHVTRDGFEDGYNLSTLEAMAAGMPVVSLANATSPITDGVDGFVSYDAEVLRKRCGELLGDHDLAKRIGAEGRTTVSRRFPMDRFTADWHAAIAEAGAWSPLVRAAEGQLPSVPVLMQYVASPTTTGRYMEHALRNRHEVVSAGFRIPEEVLQNWGYPATSVFYLRHDLDLPLEASARQVIEHLPDGFEPAIYLWIDSGQKELPPDFDAVPCPKVCYLIDTHIAPDIRIEIARHFDYVYLAQKGQVELFREAGIRNVQWLPLACSPELHRLGDEARTYDWAFVGAVADGDVRRRKLIEDLKEIFPNHFAGRAWPDEMARIYNQSKIVVNVCANRDVNMRVFEAMASGALLITDDAVGMDDLYEEGVHYVRYNDIAEVPGLIEKYLKDDAARERIAQAGKAHTLANHTYDARIEELLHTVLDDHGLLAGIHGEARYAKGGYYRNTRQEILPHVPEGTKRVLDVGCGAGDFGRTLKETTRVEEVVGIEIVERAWELAKENLDDAILGSIEDMELPFEDDYFDLICCNDVLEHLVDPLDALKKLRRVLRPGGHVIISIPNARYYDIVNALANGRWEYVDAGIMDRTHLRFFTATELVIMLQNADFQLARLEPLSYVDETHLPRHADGSLDLGRTVVKNVSDQEWLEFRTYQWLAVGKKPEGATLDDAREALEQNDNERAYSLAEMSSDDDGPDRALIMAKAVGRMGNVTEAEELYRSLLDADPDNAEAAGQLGIVLVAQNRPGEAEVYLDAALRADPVNDRLLGARGLTYVAAGRIEEALDSFRRALEANKRNEALIPHLISTAESLGRVEEIVPIVQEFVDFFPGKIDIGCQYARMLIKVGKHSEAHAYLEMAAALDPGHTEVNAILAELKA